jgi:hypothetical protein
MAPFMAHIRWPESPWFYLAVLLTVPTGVFSDIRGFNVIARFGGGVVARVSPLVIILCFLAWFFFDPSLMGKYAAKPLNTALVLAALSGCVYFSSRMAKCKISRSAFIQMLPALIGYTCSTTLNKFAMGHGELTSVVFCYMYLQSMLAVPTIGLYVCWHETRAKDAFKWRTKRMAMASMLAAAGWIASMTFRNYAMAFVPNPAYIAAIGQMTPVFISVFYRAVGHKEEADVKSGLGVVACASLLALATA